MRKYLSDLERECDDARQRYIDAVFVRQQLCEHQNVLEHIDDRYHMFRVCEDCGITCRAPWSSPVHAFGHTPLMKSRAYKVSWSEFAKACPKFLGWCQKGD